MSAVPPTSSNLYQSLTMMRQNLDVLISQTGAVGSGETHDTELAAKVDKLSESFASAEHKLEERIDEQGQEFKLLRTDNSALRKRLDEEVDQVKAMEQQAAAEKHKAALAATQTTEQKRNQGQVQQDVVKKAAVHGEAQVKR